jgi:hypothetical protein
MIRNIVHKVEELDNNRTRFPVYGGWIVSTHLYGNHGKIIGISSSFVSDPDQQWKHLKPPVEEDTSHAR